jgi:ammonia channel protein AmtB
LRATFGFSSLSLSFFFFILHQIAFEIHTLSTWLNADWSKGNTDNVFALFNILFEVCMQHLTTSSGEKSMYLNEHGGLLFPIVIMLFYFLPYCNLLWKSHNLVWATCENL